MAYTYILRCADGTFYTGSARNLTNRLEQHMSGNGSAYTAKRLPVELVWHLEFDRIEDAYALEKQIQGWSRRKRLALVENRVDDLPGMGSRARHRSTAVFRLGDGERREDGGRREDGVS